MLASQRFGGISRNFSNKMKRALVAFMAPPLALSACSVGGTMNYCTYLDAFEREVAVEEFTPPKAREDALKMVSQGKVVFVGGYLETGPITNVMRRSEPEYPEREIEAIATRYGLDNMDKVYLTKNLNEIKSDIFYPDDGIVNGSQVERECHTAPVRAYAVEFNRTMITELLEKN